MTCTCRFQSGTAQAHLRIHNAFPHGVLMVSDYTIAPPKHMFQGVLRRAEKRGLILEARPDPRFLGAGKTS